MMKIMGVDKDFISITCFVEEEKKPKNLTF